MVLEIEALRTLERGRHALDQTPSLPRFHCSHYMYIILYYIGNHVEYSVNCVSVPIISSHEFFVISALSLNHRSVSLAID